MLSLVVSHRQGWSVITWLLTLLAGMVPFAFVAVEAFLKKEQRRNPLSATEA